MASQIQPLFILITFCIFSLNPQPAKSGKDLCFLKHPIWKSRVLLLDSDICFESIIAFPADNATIPAFAFSWLNENETFVAGETALIKVIVLGNYENGKYEFPFQPNITVNDKMGNSSFMSEVSLHFNGATENWRISFVPIMVGLFNVLITDEHFRVLDSSLSFRVNPGLDSVFL